MAFPTTPILDNFNRADEIPIAAPWVIIGGADCRIVSNQFATSGGAYRQAYYSAFSSTDVEFYATMATFTGEMYMMFRMNGTTDANKTGYNVYIGDTVVTLSRHPGPELGTFNIVPASGDSIGVSAVRTALEVWFKVGAAAWTRIIQVNDGAYTSGYCLLQCADTICRWDDFGGGAISPLTGTAFTSFLSRGA